MRLIPFAIVGTGKGSYPLQDLLSGTWGVSRVVARRYARHRNCCGRMTPMYKDEIIEEVWKNRQTYTKRQGNSLARMVADLQRRQRKPLSRLVDRRQTAKGSPVRGR